MAKLYTDKEIKSIRLQTENKLLELNKTKYRLAKELNIDCSSLYRVLNGTLINYSVLEKLQNFISSK